VDGGRPIGHFHMHVTSADALLVRNHPELRPDSPATEEELLERCRKILAPYKAPRRIFIVDAGSLPQNDNGKMLRRVLREQFLEKAG